MGKMRKARHPWMSAETSRGKLLKNRETVREIRNIAFPFRREHRARMKHVDLASEGNFRGSAEVT